MSCDQSDPLNLEQENALLQTRLKQMEARERFLWGLLLETSRKLQSSSASIKAAVSSLLNYDIFWDIANQREFLETINVSIDQVSELVMLVNIESRLRGGTLEFKREPHYIQEIITLVRVNLLRKQPEFVLQTNFPDDGKLVDVDYSYLTIALENLLTLVSGGFKTSPIQLSANQENDRWHITIAGIDPKVAALINDYCLADISLADRPPVTGETALQLHIAYEILKLHEIQLAVADNLTEMSLFISFTGK